VVDWLLAGDVSVRYRTHCDLLHRDSPTLQARIATEGDGAAILAARGADGHWGRGFYQPKWTSSHYTLLELKNLGLSPGTPRARETVNLILTGEAGPDGGLNPSRTIRQSDACVNGMALNYSSYFGGDPERLAAVVDFLLRQRMPDGGFNCRLNRAGARHGSVHTTLSVVEGVTEYQRSGHGHRSDELAAVSSEAVEFLLRHHLYRSERTGRPMDPELTRLHHPSRWHFDVLRCLDAFVDAEVPYDPRMDDAVGVIEARRRADGRWPANRGYPGATHLPPTPAGQPDRWITLMATRVLATYAGGPAR
jgi:hypothetical protein